MKNIVLLVFALAIFAGCATQHQQHTGADVRPDSWRVVDAAIAAWLRDSLNLNHSKPSLHRDEVLILRKNGLPEGCSPNVPSQKIMIEDIPQHQGSSGGKADIAGRAWKVSTHIVQIDAIRIKGDTAEVEISDDRHHNLGASGATYKLKRTDTGWFVLPMTEVWIS